MDYQQALQKLERLRQGMEPLRGGGGSPEQAYEIGILYGEVAELVERLIGVDRIEVQMDRGGPAVFRNFIEAGYLSGRLGHQQSGYMQLLKVIGKVKQLAEADPLPLLPPSLPTLLQTLNRFRQCCEYVQPPRNEKEVQDIVWIMLRSQFDRVDRENMLPTFGLKAYRPDFGLPDLGTFVEIKFIGAATSPKDIQEEIQADVPGYLQKSGQYTGIVVLIYDAAQKLRDDRKLVEDLRKVEGILDVIVIPGVG